MKHFFHLTLKSLPMNLKEDMVYYKYLRIQKSIHIPNYLIKFSSNSSIDLETIHTYSISISNSYYKKIHDKFYEKFSFISYNPYAFQKLQSKSKKFKNCRRCILAQYVIVYKIYKDYVEILNIFHSRSNYKK